MRTIIPIVILAFAACASTPKTRAHIADQYRSDGQYLKAVAYYKAALDSDIPSDHPQAREVTERKNAALYQFANREGRSSMSESDLDMRFRTLVKTKLTGEEHNPKFSFHRAEQLSNAFDQTAQSFVKKEKNFPVGRRLQRLRKLAHNSPKDSWASQELSRVEAAYYTEQSQKQARSPGAFPYLHSIAAKSVQRNHPLTSKPDVSIALKKERVDGACANAATQIATIEESALFEVPYQLRIDSCAPTKKETQRVESYQYTAYVKKAVSVQVPGKRVCRAVYSQSPGLDCTSGTCVKTSVHTTSQKCTTPMVTKTIMKTVPVRRTAQRTVHQVTLGHSVRGKVGYLVGTKRFWKPFEFETKLTDTHYQTPHGNKQLSISAPQAYKRMLLDGKALLQKQKAEVGRHIGDLVFASATRRTGPIAENEKALSAILYAPSAEQWLLETIGITYDDMQNTLANVPLSVATVKVDLFRPPPVLSTDSVALTDPGWKIGTGARLRPGLSLELANSLKKEFRGYSATLAHRGGEDFLRTRVWGRIDFQNDINTDNLGFAAGLSAFFGEYSQAKTFIYQAGWIYAQQKLDGTLSHRLLGLDADFYYPIGNMASLDGGLEINFAGAWEDTIDTSWPVYLGTTIYLGPHFHLGARATNSLFPWKTTLYSAFIAARM